MRGLFRLGRIRSDASEERLMSRRQPARAKHDGLTVVLTSVDNTEEAVVLQLALSDDQATTERLAAWEAAHERWNERWLAAGHPTGNPPAQPAEAVNQLEMALLDDVGTAYRIVASSAGGTGTERLASIRFAPGVPDEASRLTVEALGRETVLRRSGNEQWSPA